MQSEMHLLGTAVEQNASLLTTYYLLSYYALRTSLVSSSSRMPPTLHLSLEAISSSTCRHS